MDTADSSVLVERELAAMAGECGETEAQLARVAWQLTTNEGGPEDFTQLKVQEFCWATLVTLVEGTAEVRWRMACALADLLERLGLGRYAGIARGADTQEVVESVKDGDVAVAAVREKAWDASGVRPPDTDLLTWGTEQGPGERYTYEQVAGSLEMAVLAGDLRPRGPGWQKAATAITGALLTSPHSGSAGHVPLPGILEERFHRWARYDTPRRLELMFSLGPALTAGEPALGPVPVELLGPLRYVLDRGRVRAARADVEQVVEASAMDVAVRAELVRVEAGQVLVTERGRQALRTQTALAGAFARGWVGRSGQIDVVVRELVAALLLHEPGTVSELVEQVVALLDESGWRRGDDRPLTTGDVEPIVLEAWEELLDLHLIREPGWTLVPVEGARPVLLECLRQRLAHADLPNPRLC